jgi:apoptosis-inducing factor 3
MSGQAELTGPDFTAGVPASSIEDGKTLLGHANGEAVLLARFGNEYVAVAASCTHYGGPLAEGLIDGETVRCPWHHACFNLRTGEALEAPALSPLACWTVEKRDEKILVTGKKERDPLSPTYPFRAAAGVAPRGIVIVGAGAAGSAAAEMTRRCGYGGRITVIDDDFGSPYDRPNLSKDYLAGNAPEEWIPLRAVDFYAEHDVEILRGHVTSIDAKVKTVNVEGHRPVQYDALLLATGSEPIRLDIPGAGLPHVYTLRSLNDSRSIANAAEKAKRAVVIGGSFIGLEAAASLRARDVEVHVVAPESRPLERVLGEHLGDFIRALHEEKGVTFHLGRKPASINAAAVTLDDGSVLEADVVVMGVGVRPRLALADEIGLAMDRGVAVDEHLQTSIPGVFAAGDIARWPDPHTGDQIRVEHWVVAQRQGQTAARNMLGATERFDSMPFFWSAHYDVSINYVGHAEKWDRVVVNGDASKRDVSVSFMRGDKRLALATIFRDQESLRAEREG